MKLRQTLIDYTKLLKQESKNICMVEGCFPEEHFCRCYAYFDLDINDNEIDNVFLIDICIPGQFEGIADTKIKLPFNGDYRELLKMLKDNMGDK